MQRLFSSVTFALLFSLYGSAQIVNIEGMRIFTAENVPFKISSGLDVSYNNNDGNYVFVVGAHVGSLYKFKDGKGKLNNKIFINGNYNLVRAEDRDLNNNWFVHLRFNKEITPEFRIETFVQSQQNELLSISTRNLVGAGIRWKVLEAMKKRSLHLYLGAAYMYEYEKSKRFDVKYNNNRLSSYLSASFNWGEGKPKIINVLYFQPLFDELDNFRLSQQFTGEFPVSKSVSFTTNFSYFLNNRTPIGDAEYFSNVSFGIKYNFEKKIEEPESPEEESN